MDLYASSSEEDIIVKIICEDDESSESSESDWTNISCSEDEEERRTLVRTINFVEKIVPNMDDKLFQQHFRISRRTMQYLLNDFEQSNTLRNYKAGRENVTVEKALLMTLWYLANKETYRELADRFNVAQSTALLLIRKVVNYLISARNRFIKWPNEEEAIRISNSFKNRQGIGGVIGAIDGTHININKPSKDQNAYCNRKGQHSIILQGVVDDKKRFINVFCGEAGSNHDARVLKRSNLYKECSTSGLPNNTFLVGDSAYPNLSWLVVPFKDNGNLTQNQHTFNYRHSSTRIIVENAFGLLKGRFRRLMHFDNFNINFIVKAVIAACVLHNICITMDDLNIDYRSADVLDDGELQDFLPNNDVIENPGLNRRQLVFNEMFLNTD